MNKPIILVTLGALLLVSACKNKPQSHYVSVTAPLSDKKENIFQKIDSVKTTIKTPGRVDASTPNYRLKFDTAVCEIPIDTSLRFFYKKTSVDPQSEVLCGYNPGSHKLDFYNVGHSKYLSSCKIPRVGLNFNNDILGVYYLNKDSVFLMSRSSILLIDTTGKFKKSIEINRKSSNGFFRANNFYDWDTNGNLYFDKNTKQLLVPTVPVDIRNGQPDYYSRSILSGMNIDGNNYINPLPIYYPDLYREYYYGYMNNPTFTYLPDHKIVCSFPIEPNLYIYDTQTKKSRVVGGAVKPHNAVSDHLEWENSADDDKKLKNLMENVDYVSFTFDPFKNLYYRLQYDPLYGKNKGYQSAADRKQILTVFNKQFKVVAVIELNDRAYFFFSAFVTRNGLYIAAPHGKENLRFKIFKFSNT